MLSISDLIKQLQKMRFIFIKPNFAINRVQFIKKYPYSTGSLGLWNEELSTTIKHKIEEHWIPKLKQLRYDAKDHSKPKFYVLSMFPYPSGNLHMGHVRVYAISDTIARFHRMLGKNVFQPMGWDAFGLPAENAAIERKELPEVWTYKNIETMKKQLEDLQFTFDWDTEITTCNPDYYKFTQYIFLKLFHEGLVYYKEAYVNWDPVDKTVLADEQVAENGRSWRSGAKVEKKLLKQWFIRTTRFAKSLFDGLDDPILKDWKEVAKLQKQWIGECNGTTFDFKLVGGEEDGRVLTVWTSKAEHLGIAEFIAVSPDSWYGKNSDCEISRLLNCQAVNPLTGDRLPVYVTDQVEYNFQAQCRLGIPCVFESDLDFANSVNLTVKHREFVDDNEEERNRICKEARLKNIGGYPVSSRLRDWLISRQRYWGTPIPLVHCNTCGMQPVKFEDLPVLLSPLDNKEDGSNLKHSSEWIKATCPKCGGEARRETDTMDTFVDSSWYYLRYTDPHNLEVPFDTTKANKLAPVDIYIGGKEHAVLHLYYARFMSHFFHSIGWLKEREPFKQMIVQGMINGRTYRVKGTGKYLREHEVTNEGKKFFEKETGTPVVRSWEKMSKSKYNGVEPADMLKQYGVDTTRLLVLADVAPTSPRNWNEQTFPGVTNWQHRSWLTVKEFLNARSQRETLEKNSKFEELDHLMWDSRNYYLKGITYCYKEACILNVVISKLQGLTGSLRKSSPDVKALSGEFERALAVQIIMLAPIAPYFASELWAGFQEAPGRINKVPGEIDWDKSVLEQSWPDVDPHYNLSLDFVVNGQEVGSVLIPRSKLDSLSEDDALTYALSDEEVKNVVHDRIIEKVIYNPIPSYKATISIYLNRIEKVKKYDEEEIEGSVAVKDSS